MRPSLCYGHYIVYSHYARPVRGWPSEKWDNTHKGTLKYSKLHTFEHGQDCFGVDGVSDSVFGDTFICGVVSASSYGIDPQHSTARVLVHVITGLSTCGSRVSIKIFRADTSVNRYAEKIFHGTLMSIIELCLKWNDPVFRHIWVCFTWYVWQDHIATRVSVLGLLSY